MRAQLALELGLHGVAARLARPPVSGSAEARDGTDAELRRDGELWRVRHHGSSAHLRDLKGLSDLAVLLARPGVDVHVLELAGAGHSDRDSGTLLDATARADYRRAIGRPAFSGVPRRLPVGLGLAAGLDRLGASTSRPPAGLG